MADGVQLDAKLNGTYVDKAWMGVSWYGVLHSEIVPRVCYRLD